MIFLQSPKSARALAYCDDQAAMLRIQEFEVTNFPHYTPSSNHRTSLESQFRYAAPQSLADPRKRHLEVSSRTPRSAFVQLRAKIRATGKESCNVRCPEAYSTEQSSEKVEICFMRKGREDIGATATLEDVSLR